MQISFNTEHLPEEFSAKNENLFPDAPIKCPFKDCSMPVKLKKHGFYSRYLISKCFKGVLYIRRFICPICGRTISLLPVFCLRNFQYSGPDIINMLHELYETGIPLKRLVERTKEYFPAMERRHINYYKRRIIKNRHFIQYGLNLISPEFANEGSIPENQIWIKNFLEKVNKMQPIIFLVNFFKNTGKSFMTLQI